MSALRVALLAILRSARFRYSNEAELQEGIQRLLADNDLAHEREAVLTDGERIDFLVGSVGVEVKIAGSSSEVFRQLMRYAKLPKISALILITDKTRIANGMPGTILSKPLHVVCLAEASL